MSSSGAVRLFGISALTVLLGVVRLGVASDGGSDGGNDGGKPVARPQGDGDQPARGASVLPDTVHDWSALDTLVAETLGWWGQTAGDLDANGQSDIILGDIAYDTGLGAAVIFYGSSGGLPGPGSPPQASYADGWLVQGSSETFGWYVSTIGDVNDDGRDEVAIRDIGGNVDVYYGDPFGNTFPDWRMTGCTGGGITASSAGDVDADGYDDLLVHCGSEVGIFLGGLNGLKLCSASDCTISDADWRVSNTVDPAIQHYASDAGDVNSDGFDDVIVGFTGSTHAALVFHGPLTGQATVADADWRFATANTLRVETAGDVDCDGFDDVVILDTGPELPSTVGAVHVFHGSAGGLKDCGGPCMAADADWTVTGQNRPDGAGDDLVYLGTPGTAGDFDGDGFGDLIVGVQFDVDAPGSPDEGRPGAAIFFGSATGLPNCAGTQPPSCVATDAPWQTSFDGPTLPPQAANAFVSGAGDVNGDHGSDVIVSYPNAPLGGQAFVYHGNPDLDGDGFSVAGGDCDDTEAAIYPGAEEILDGIDNQCAWDKTGNPDGGFGLVDEIPGEFGFPEPDRLAWPSMEGAATFQVARSTSADFSTDCTSFVTSDTSVADAEAPSPAAPPLHYLVRALTPLMGSWGRDSAGVERAVACGGEVVCDDGADDDGDGLTDCDDSDCVGDWPCLASFTFRDRSSDDLRGGELFRYFQGVPASQSDYISFEIEIPGAAPVGFCAVRADFYRDNYLLLAATGGSVNSGNWPKWFRDSSGAWVPDADPFPPNSTGYGTDCGDLPEAWCPERADLVASVRPLQTGTCEAVTTRCGDGGWTASIRISPLRRLACGF